MAKNSKLGNYLWRGGRKIKLEKEEEVFTALIKDDEDLNRVRSLAGVKEVKPV